VGKEWRITGSVLKAGKRVKLLEKTLSITSEQGLDDAEREMRGALYEEACKMFKKSDFADVTLEVKNEIEKQEE
jgi:hypothetical protein